MTAWTVRTVLVTLLLLGALGGPSTGGAPTSGGAAA